MSENMFVCQNHLWSAWDCKHENPYIYNPAQCFICCFKLLGPDDETNTEETVVVPYIDRGVDAFVEFATVLRKAFPKLKHLRLAQNYSYISHHHCLLADFLTFLRMLQLERLTWTDSQSEFILKLTNDALFAVMPANAVYTFVLDEPRLGTLMFSETRDGRRIIVIKA